MTPLILKNHQPEGVGASCGARIADIVSRIGYQPVLIDYTGWSLHHVEANIYKSDPGKMVCCWQDGNTVLIMRKTI